MAFTKMLWADSMPPVISGSWNYWKSVSGSFIYFNSGGNYFSKEYNVICYFAACHVEGSSSCTVVLISPNQSAVSYRDSSYNSYGAKGTITDSQGNTWYWSGFDRGGGIPDNPDMILNNTDYPLTNAGGEQAAQDLLDKVFAIPFQEDYQNAHYTLGRTDKERTIRKALGLWLAFTTSNYSNPNVQYISDNADTIIGTMVNKVSSSTDIRFYIYARYSNVNRGVYLNLYYANNASDIVASIVQKSSYRGLEYYTASAISPQPPFTNLYSLYIDAGSPTVTETSGTYYFNTIGMYSTSLYDKDTTNFGVDY